MFRIFGSEWSVVIHGAMEASCDSSIRWRRAILSPRSSLRFIKLPAWILATSFPGTGGNDGERSIAGACDAAGEVVCDGTGAVRSEADQQPAGRGADVDAAINVRATDNMRNSEGSASSGSAEDRE